MTDMLEERRPTWVVPTPSIEGPEFARSVSITLTGDVEPELIFEAQHGDEVWSSAASLSDIERFLADAQDGLASSVQLGPELALVQPGAEDITVPVGPFELVGSLADWRAILEREKADRQDGFEPPADARMERFEGERSSFPVLDTD